MHYYCLMAKQRNGARTAVIAIGIVMAMCNAGALYMYAVVAGSWYRYPYFPQVARAMSPAIGSMHRGEWGIHWGYGEWAMLAGSLLHLAGLIIYARTSGVEKRLLYVTNAMVLLTSAYFIFYFLVLEPRRIYFVMPGTTAMDFWGPLIGEALMRVWWLLLATVTIVVLAAGDERQR